jgi:hypothetical protein
MDSEINPPILSGVVISCSAAKARLWWAAVRTGKDLDIKVVCNTTKQGSDLAAVCLVRVVAALEVVANAVE